ncbi:hypothetical protein ACFW2Y_22350 [Streptomyces sp. NPDC058877]|uniref:hypothetical protein n=1 Tax=Streptomyces sp. NPDC058877 TaxID=3346665 RepID=UPI0036C01977
MPDRNSCPSLVQTAVPDLGTYMAMDTVEGSSRFGRVTAWDGDLVHLVPPGGGAEWTAAPTALRRPNEEECARIRVLTSPVPTVTP